MSQKTFLILYGSVTGKAQSIAELIHNTSEDQGFKSKLFCFNQTDKYNLSEESCLVIVSSTTGDGEQPENAIEFLKSISKRNIPENYFDHLQYSILGLGDTNYSQFCNGPKTLHSRLLSVGAKTFYEPGWADDGTGLEAVVEPWIEGLWEALEKCAYITPTKKTELLKISETESEHIHSDVMSASDVESLLLQFQAVGIDDVTEDLKTLIVPEGDLAVPNLSAPSYILSFEEGNEFRVNDIPEDWSPKFPLSTTPVVQVPIVKSRKLTKDGSHKTTLEITMDLQGTNIVCEPGDSISILCSNPDLEVDLLLKRLGCIKVADFPAKISLASSAPKSAKIPDYFPPSWTLRYVLTHCLDIRSVPKKPLIRVLSEFTTDPTEKRILDYLCSRQGSSVYLERIRGSNLCLLDLLFTFTSCNPPVERIVDQLPRLMPRPYSVASHNVNQNLIDIVFNLIEIPPGKGRKFSRKGLCTGYLQEVSTTLPEKVPKISVFGRQNKNFRPPDKLDMPFIMIGPGSGVAPFRGFLQKRRQQLKGMDAGSNLGSSWLFFGCRNAGKDFIYESELNEFVNDSTLTRLFVTFSRDDPESKVRYVQDLIDANKSEFVDMIYEKGSTIFVCGDAKNMSKDVNEMIIKCTSTVLGITIQEARCKVADLVINGRYLQDVWT